MTTTTIPTPRQILAAAADEIDHRGWTQGEYLTSDGEVNIVDAMRLATADLIGLDASGAEVTSRRGSVWPESTRAELKAAFDDAVQLVAGQVGGQNLNRWNDRLGRTAAEVVAVLREAAKLCDGYHGDCEGCDRPLDCEDDWRSGECDDCWQTRDEMGA